MGVIVPCMKRGESFFVTSLDFELFWGMSDKTTIETYGANIIGERSAIPRTLSLFATYGIHATWATVGMLMARNKTELLSLLPPLDMRPKYEDTHASTYEYINRAHIGTSEEDDAYHFGESLVKLIQKTPHQEIANHTFSHYYCIDGRQNEPALFARDIETFNTVAKIYGITATSIVFPRNQASHEALYTCAEKGLRAYRGTESHILYEARKDSAQTRLIRGLRLLDHYINISGHHTYTLPHKDTYGLYNIPASRFLRPHMKTLALLEPLRIRRIKRAMTHAAKNGEIFHLWWHPHNMGIDQEENFNNLEKILLHFRMLQKKYGMQSSNMNDITTLASL